MQADLRGRVQAQVGGAQGDDFLDPRAGVEHGGEERVVAAAVDGAAVHGAEDGLDLPVLEVLDGTAAGPLERDGEDALTVHEPRGGTPWRKYRKNAWIAARRTLRVAALLCRSSSRC